jgi:hypothetical protein
LKEIVFPVWTPQGVEFLKKILKIEYWKLKIEVRD